MTVVGAVELWTTRKCYPSACVATRRVVHQARPMHCSLRPRIAEKQRRSAFPLCSPFDILRTLLQESSSPEKKLPWQCWRS